MVVVPVYRDCELTRACLASAMPGVLRCPGARLVAINDASPDAEMDDMLGKEARLWGEKLVVIRNDANLGFVKTANRGIRYDDQADIVLLNNDVILPDRWLERLLDDVDALADAGTVTPLSNNTTISSFPNFVAENPYPLQLDLDRIDEAFQVARLNPVDAPTGIGFCMYIKRQCLTEVGELNERSFGTGYGEESDFCQRALQKGWKSYISPNLYVHHRGGVSFGDQRTERIRHANQTLDRLYPNYHADVQAFVAKDELRRPRLQRFLDLTRASALPIVLHVSHGLGGGISQHIEDLAKRSDGRLISLLLRPEDGGRLVSVGAWDADWSMRIAVNTQQSLGVLLLFLKAIGVDLVHYHHVLGLPLEYLTLGESLGVPQIFTVHDFYLVNGNPTLTDKRGVFDPMELDQAHNPLYPLPKGVGCEDWRERYRGFLAACDRTIFPSYSTALLFKRFFNVRNALLAYHPEDKTDNPLRSFLPKETYTIGVLGALSREKGADLLEAAAALATKRQLKVRFTLIGYAYRPLTGVKTTGPYESERLVGLIDAESCDLIAFPALWPETYSYTLSAALASGLPIVAPCIGAFPERLAGRDQTALLPHPPSADELLATIQKLLSKLERGEQSASPPVAAAQGCDRSYYEQQYVVDVGTPRGPAERREVVVALDALLAARQAIVVHGPRERFLRTLWRVYTNPSTRAISRLIPHRLKRAVKRLLSKRPMHEVIGN